LQREESGAVGKTTRRSAHHRRRSTKHGMGKKVRRELENGMEDRRMWCSFLIDDKTEVRPREEQEAQKLLEKG